MAERDFTQELRDVQTQTKTLATKREGLIRDAGVQQQKVTEALAKLVELGITDADKMTVPQLQALRDKKKAELETGMVALQAKVTEGNQLLTEYETATA